MSNTFRSTASGSRNLRYFEFDAPGLYVIDDNAFSQIANLADISIIGGTINIIKGGAFTGAFNVQDAPEGEYNLIIDGSITVLNSSSFGSQRRVGSSHIALQIGTSDRPTSLTNFRSAFSGNANIITKITIYTSNRDADVFASNSALLNSLFGNGSYDESKYTINIVG